MRDTHLISQHSWSTRARSAARGPLRLDVTWPWMLGVPAIMGGMCLVSELYQEGAAVPTLTQSIVWAIARVGLVTFAVVWLLDFVVRLVIAARPRRTRPSSPRHRQRR